MIDASGVANDLLPAHLVAYAGDGDGACIAVRNGPAIGALLRAEQGDGPGASQLLAIVGHSEWGSDSASGLNALADVTLGNPESAVERTGHASLAHRRAGFPFVTVGRIEAFASMHDWDSLADLIPLARAQVDQMRLLGPGADRAEGVLQVARGDRAEAVPLLRRALEGFTEMGIVLEAAQDAEVAGGSR